MDNKLNYCELKMKTYDLEEVPDSVIKAVIGNLNKDDAMLSVLFNCYHQLNSDKNKDSFDYFTNLVDKIASFFEREENWRALKNCWLENDRSNDLRNLLHKALKE